MKEVPTKAIPKKLFLGSEEVYYLVNVKCLNCGFEGEVYVKKRLPLHFAYCPHCECNKSLIRIETKIDQTKTKRKKRK